MFHTLFLSLWYVQQCKGWWWGLSPGAPSQEKCSTIRLSWSNFCPKKRKMWGTVYNLKHLCICSIPAWQELDCYCGLKSLALLLWEAKYLTFLSLHFLTCKMWIIIWKVEKIFNLSSMMNHPSCLHTISKRKPSFPLTRITIWAKIFISDLGNYAHLFLVWHLW